MNLEELRMEIEAKGMNTDGLDDEQVVRVGQALDLDVPVRVTIEPYTNKRGSTANYVKTDGFPLPTNGDGKKSTAKGLFVRVEVVDQAILALQTAKAMLGPSATS